MSKSDPFIFEGFEPANTTPVPDVLFDVLLPKLSGAELKVLLYIIRRTTGFKKTSDTISFTQFEKGIITKDGRVLDNGCGLSRETISQALAGLEAKGCIKSHKRNTTSGDKDTSAYSVRFKGDVVGKSDYPTWSEKTTTLVGKSDHGGQKSRLPVVGKSDIQETVLQETVLQEGTFGANAPARAQLKEEHEILFEEATEKLEEVKRATDKHKAIKLSENDTHSQEEDDTPTVKQEAVKIGAMTHGQQHSSSHNHDSLPAVLRPPGLASDQGLAHGLDRHRGPDDLLRVTPGGVPDAHSRADDARPGHVATASVIPKRPRRPVAQEKPQLTLEGQQVKEWYEEAREAKVRMTDKNVIACNRLAEIDGMSSENLKEVIDLWDGDKWVKEHNISIDLQELEKPDSKFSFERGLLLVRRKHKGKASALSNGNAPVNDYSLTALLERQAAAEGV